MRKVIVFSVFLCLAVCIKAKAQDGDAAQWITSSWNRESFLPAENNLLLGKWPDSFSGFVWWDGSTKTYTPTDGGAFVDINAGDKANSSIFSAIPSDCAWTYTLAKSAVIDEVRIYGGWGDNGRDEISIKSIVVTTYDGDAITISPNETNVVGKAYTDSDGRSYYLSSAILKRTDGQSLCENASKITFNFGVQENNYAGYAEIEVIGTVNEYIPEKAYWTPDVWFNGISETEASLFNSGANLIHGKEPKFVSGLVTGDGSNTSRTLTDGEVVCGNVTSTTALWNNSIVSYEFDYRSIVDEVKVYTTWADINRAELSVASIEFVSASGITNTVSPCGITYIHSNKCVMALLKKPDGSPIGRDVREVIFKFGVQKNGYAGYSELVVLGRADVILSSEGMENVCCKLIHDGKCTFDLEASCGNNEGVIFDWDLDGDGDFEILNGGVLQQVHFNEVGFLTVKVKERNSGTIKEILLKAYPSEVWIAAGGKGGNVFPYDSIEKAANDLSAIDGLIESTLRQTIHLLPGQYSFSFSVGPNTHLMADDPTYGATVVSHASERVFEVAGDGAVISGLTISGGGMSNPVGWNESIPYTQAEAFPGGACVYVHDKGMVSNCWIRNPNCTLRGGAGGCIYNDNGRILDCVIGNVEISLDVFYGAGVFQKGNDALMERCVVRDVVLTKAHAATIHRAGGAIQMVGGVVRNCLVTGCKITGFTHSADWLGQVDSPDSTPAILAGGGRIENCTVTGNIGYLGAGGIITYGEAKVFNAISYGNLLNDEKKVGIVETADFYRIGEEGEFKYCCLGAELSGEGNIFNDPLFKDAESGIFSLKKDSPCRNKADKSQYTGDIKGLDLALNPRLKSAKLDMGAYEYQANSGFIVLVK